MQKREPLHTLQEGILRRAGEEYVYIINEHKQA